MVGYLEMEDRGIQDWKKVHIELYVGVNRILFETCPISVVWFSSNSLLDVEDCFCLAICYKWIMNFPIWFESNTQFNTSNT